MKRKALVWENQFTQFTFQKPNNWFVISKFICISIIHCEALINLYYYLQIVVYSKVYAPTKQQYWVWSFIILVSWNKFICIGIIHCGAFIKFVLLSTNCSLLRSLFSNKTICDPILFWIQTLDANMWSTSFSIQCLDSQLEKKL
jgi:hypothetical protein